MPGPPEETRAISLLAHFWRRRIEDIVLYFLTSLHLFVMWSPLNFQTNLVPLGCSDECDVRVGTAQDLPDRAFLPAPVCSLGLGSGPGLWCRQAATSWTEVRTVCWEEESDPTPLICGNLKM